ncbi:MAG: GPW/gp25 family protein [Clostridiales bacterium]|jgi:phage baseplate assembly protein W|nr:GPW/gp25 family protein [Clostridiales bacterium]
MAIEVSALSGDIIYGAAGVSEIIQNVRTLLTTRKGTQPLDREFGLSFSFLDDPTPVATAAIQNEVIQAVRKYEPRAVIKAVRFDNDPLNGKVYPTVRIEVRQ